VQENDWSSISRLFVMETDVIFRDGIGHLSFLLVGRPEFCS
jgi:hypothetical protein